MNQTEKRSTHLMRLNIFKSDSTLHVFQCFNTGWHSSVFILYVFLLPSRRLSRNNMPGIERLKLSVACSTFILISILTAATSLLWIKSTQSTIVITSSNIWKHEIPPCSIFSSIMLNVLCFYFQHVELTILFSRQKWHHISFCVLTMNWTVRVNWIHSGSHTYHLDITFIVSF